MKRLTRDERKGATWVVIVSLLICGGSYLIKRMQHSCTRIPDEELVKMIVIATDSSRREENESGHTDFSKADRDKKKDKKNTGGKKKGKEEKKKRKSGKEKVEKKSPSGGRDFLSEPL